MARPVFRKMSAVAGEPTRRARLDPDRALVVAAQADPARFDALYRKYVAQVYSFALYELRDRFAAEDATERTFVNALGALPSFEERVLPSDPAEASTFRIWLFRIARNAVANEQRTVRRHPTAPLEAALGVADSFDHEAQLGLRESVAEAWAAVERLPAERRQAIVLRFVEEMSTAEIASILGKSPGAVRILLHRALRSVARDLNERTPRTDA